MTDKALKAENIVVYGTTIAPKYINLGGHRYALKYATINYRDAQRFADDHGDRRSTIHKAKNFYSAWCVYLGPKTVFGRKRK
jgi:hypothetical protein